MFGCKMEEIAGTWTKLHNDGFHSFKASANIMKSKQIKECEIDGECRAWRKRELYTWNILVGSA